MEIVFARVVDQCTKRVVMALQKDDGTFVDAVTIHDGKSMLNEQIEKAHNLWVSSVVKWPECFVTEVSNALEVKTSPRAKVNLHMCSRGIYGSHMVALNKSDTLSGNSALEVGVHSVPLDQLVYIWANSYGLTPEQTFWFVASVMSRYDELCTREELDWGNFGDVFLWI